VHVKKMEEDKTKNLSQIPSLRDGTPAQDVITPVCCSLTGGLGKLALGFFRVLAAIAHPGDDDDPETKAIRALWVNHRRKVHTCMLIHTAHDAVCRKRDSIHRALVANARSMHGGEREWHRVQQHVRDRNALWTSGPLGGGVAPLGPSDVAPLSPLVDPVFDLGVGAHGAEMSASVWSVPGGLGGGSFSCSRGGGARAD
jgi:hypothetical protein